MLALIAGGAYAIHFFGAGAQTAPPTATPTFTTTFTPTSTITQTRTPWPTATATSPPGWVTDFAGPILAAIADLPPTFQDDFGPASAGWQSVDWCGNNIDYVEGELVITKCWAFRPNINYNDFVVEFDVRFLPGADQEERFSFTFKGFSGIGDGHMVSIYPNGNVEINYQSGSHNTDTTNNTFNNAAHKGNQSNHILVIGKGSRFAIYLNNQPLSHFESPYGSYGDFGFLAGGTIVAIDNLKVWNIADISIP
jgi:hypothetical protein